MTTLPASLDPDAAAFLAKTAGAPRLEDGTPEQARAAHVASAPALAGDGPELEEVVDEHVAGVPVRRFVPADARGTTVYAHGGGWVVGTLDSYDTLCRELAAASASTVVSVGYGLAPEARHPRQVEQVLAVVRALAGSGSLAVAGDSAGGYLVALAALDEEVSLAAQALIYPVVSPALDTPSAVENARGLYLETASMSWYWDHFLGGRPATPLVARPGLPPAYVLTAGFDPLRDEGRAYADALEQAGVPVEWVEHAGQIHGFVRMTAVMGAARPALAEIGAFLRSHLRGEAPASP